MLQDSCPQLRIDEEESDCIACQDESLSQDKATLKQSYIIYCHEIPGSVNCNQYGYGFQLRNIPVMGLLAFSS